MSLTSREANAVNYVLHWAMGHLTGGNGAYMMTDALATSGAKLLATSAYKTLGAGLRPDDVELRREDDIEPGREDICGGVCPSGSYLHLYNPATCKPVELVAEGAGPLLDPDCKAGKCGSCAGPPCEHHCHGGGRP